MNHRPLIDWKTAAVCLYATLREHYGRAPTGQDYDIVDARLVSERVRVVIETTDGKRARYFIDVDADAMPEVRQALGITAH